MYKYFNNGENIENGGGILNNIQIKWQQKDKRHLLNKKNFIYYYSRMFSIDPFVAQLLFERKLETEESISSFLFPTIDQFHNPFLLQDMKKAVTRIIYALKNKETIVIFGDYDVDG